MFKRKSVYQQGWEKGYSDSKEDDALLIRNALSKENLKRSKSSSYKYMIKIVCKDCDNNFANDIRNTLNQFGNNAFVVSYDSYNSKPTAVVDYTILVGNLDNHSITRGKVIYDKVGCKIVALDKIIIIEKSDNPEKGIGNEYAKVVRTELDNYVDGEKVKRYVSEYEKTKSKDTGKNTQDWLDSFLNHVIKNGDDFANNSKWKNNIYQFSMLPFVTAVSLCCLPVGVCEVTYGEITKELKMKKLNDKIAKTAQEQIILVEICNYFRRIYRKK